MEKLFQNRRFRLLIACFSLLLLLNQIQETYAKYVSSADAAGNFTIARWAFEVNDQDIIANNDFTNTIIPTFDTNVHIANNVIAPTSTGYFDITIDSSNVGVSFTEVITLEPNDDNTVSDLVFTGYKLNNGQIVPVNNDTSLTITTDHLLGEQTTINTYRIYIEWLDGTNETMDNSDDTDASVSGNAAIDINLNFIQKAS